MSQAKPFMQNSDDFPPLGGASTPGTSTGRNLGTSASQASGGPPSNANSSSQTAPSGQLASPSGPADRFGLTGLLSVIRMSDPDLNALALGFDLTTLGLNLNSPDYLYSTFASPWTEGPTRVQPEFRIPQCYFMNPPHLRFQMFQRFQLETLFYIFYSMPCDVLQLAAAQELYNRDWRFHKEKKLWFTRAPETEPIVKTDTYEKGSFLVFDPQKWAKERKDEYVLVYDQLEEKTAVQPSESQGSGTSTSQTAAGGSAAPAVPNSTAPQAGPPAAPAAPAAPPR